MYGHKDKENIFHFFFIGWFVTWLNHHYFGFVWVVGVQIVSELEKLVTGQKFKNYLVKQTLDKGVNSLQFVQQLIFGVFLEVL